MGVVAHFCPRAPAADLACLLARPRLAAFGGRRERTDVFDSRRQRLAQGFRVVGEEGYQGATLVSGNQRDSKVAWIGVRSQIAAALHLGKAALEQLDPLVVTVGEIAMDFGIGLDEL